MDWLVLLLLSGSLLFITYEDFKERYVHVYLFVLVFFSIGYLGYIALGFNAYLIQLLVNICFVVFYFFILQLYFVVKNRKWVWIFDNYIGWGDIVFVFCVAAYWNLLGFIFFIVISLVITLLFYFLFLKQKTKYIPLAGIQSLVFLIMFFLERRNLFSVSELLGVFK